MAKAKRKTTTSRVPISFIGDIVDEAIGKLEKKLSSLPKDARNAQRVVRQTIGTLKVSKQLAKLHCDSWFFPAK